MLMTTPGAGDFPNCAPPPSTDYLDAPFSFNPVNGTYSYAVSTQASLSKPEVIIASTWAHMNDGECNGRTGTRAQISQLVDVLDSTKTVIAHTESQAPTLTDDSGGINTGVVISCPSRL
jgi:hypothetical protein